MHFLIPKRMDKCSQEVLTILSNISLTFPGFPLFYLFGAAIV